MAVLFDPFRELDRVAASARDALQGPRLMPIDLYRDGDTYVLNADLPGVDPGSIDVDVDGRVLTVRAQRTAPVIEGATWLSRERQTGAVVRKLRLGESIDTENIAADYADGVLTVSLPVAEKAKPRKVVVAGAAAAPEVAAE